MQKYKVIIAGPGVSIDKEVDSSVLTKLLPLLLFVDQEDTLIINEIDSPAQIQSQSTSVEISVQEFLRQRSPRTNPQKITAIAYYLSEFLSTHEVSTKEIRNQFVKAREPIPSHFARDLDIAIRSGWISESTTPGNYYVTDTGIQAVNGGFTQPVTRRPARKSNGTKKVTAIRDEVKNLEINPKQTGYKDYWKISKGEKILWLLVFAQDNGESDVNYKELSQLAQNIGDNIPPKSITSLIVNHKKEGRLVDPIKDGNRVLRILKPGIDHIKQSQGS